MFPNEVADDDAYDLDIAGDQISLNNSDDGKIVAGDGALRKDVVIVPSSLPSGDYHHASHCS